jgi:hypothetical protein
MISLLAVLLAAQADVASHLGLEEGRSWRYAAGSETTSVQARAAEVSGTGAFALVAGDGTSWIVTFDPEAGLLMHSTSLADGTVITYERPVVLLPASLEPGALHSVQRRFVRRRGEEKVGVGAHSFEAELLDTVSVETPAGRFEDCLEIHRHSVRMDYAGGQEDYDVTEWYAPSVGLVKASGKLLLRDASGAMVSTHSIELALESVTK